MKKQNKTREDPTNQQLINNFKFPILFHWFLLSETERFVILHQIPVKMVTIIPSDIKPERNH